jgi:fatty acid desaturase
VTLSQADKAIAGARPVRSHEYGALRAAAKKAGLFERQPWFYVKLALVLVALLAAGVAVLVTQHPFWVYLLDALFMGLVFVQIGFIGHDAAHRQIFDRVTHNEILSVLCFNVVLGGSASWWRDKHNRHHASPNHEGEDPDIELGVFAFTFESAKKSRGLVRFIVKRQAYLFFPITTMAYPSMQFRAASFLVRQWNRRTIWEGACTLLHFVLFLGPPLLILGLWKTIVFAVLVEATVGVYMAASFAPNHKGMPTVEEDERPDFLRAQVETSRNIRRGAVADFMFGSLSAQIEHHLFPNMPRNNLRQAEPLVRAFCAEHGIDYHETSVFRSFGELLGHLSAVGKSLSISDPEAARPG